MTASLDGGDSSKRTTEGSAEGGFVVGSVGDADARSPTAVPAGNKTANPFPALTGAGIPALWDALVASHARLAADGLDALRAAQSTAWMWSEVTDTLLDRLRSHPDVRRLARALEEAVAAGTVAPAAAAQQMLDAFLGTNPQG